MTKLLGDAQSEVSLPSMTTLGVMRQKCLSGLRWFAIDPCPPCKACMFPGPSPVSHQAPLQWLKAPGPILLQICTTADHALDLIGRRRHTAAEHLVTSGCEQHIIFNADAKAPIHTKPLLVGDVQPRLNRDDAAGQQRA